MAIKKTNNDTFRDVKDFIKMFGSLTPVGQYNLLAYTMNNFREQMSPDLYNVFSSLAEDRFDCGADEYNYSLVGVSNLGKNEGYGISSSEKKSIGREGFLLLQKAAEKRKLEHEIPYYSIYVTFKKPQEKHRNALNVPLSWLSLDEIKTVKGALYEKLNLNKTKKKHTGVMI